MAAFVGWGPVGRPGKYGTTGDRVGAEPGETGTPQGRGRDPFAIISRSRGERLDFPRSRRHVFIMNVQRFVPAAPTYTEQVSFDRFELGEILSVYGRYVAAGLWRDYGISCLRDRAVFAIFRRAAENPLYRVEKIPALRNRQGLYALFGPEGQVLKRGSTLKGVLAPLERKLLRPLD
jgi:Protein of unknown function (DUF2794).